MRALRLSRIAADPAKQYLDDLAQLRPYVADQGKSRSNDKALAHMSTIYP